MFKAEMHHNRDTVHSFTKTQFNVFEKKTKLIMFAVSLALLAAGALKLVGETVSLILVLLGCLVFDDVGSVPKRTADRMLKAGSKFEAVSYIFEDSHIEVLQSGKRGRVEYDSFIRIVKDRSYAYLFMNRMQVHMLELSSLEPNDAEAFFSFIESKTGLSWSGADSLMRLDIKALIKKLSRR